MNAQRLIKRLHRYRNDLFTFLYKPNVPFDNNHAERAIRPAVLTSMHRPLQQRGHAPLKRFVDTLTTYLAPGQLPPLPVKGTAIG
ncbi:transposase [Singulisphaera sp. Ch08]|uniref:IS66 family transposase n=1 Tax=Singulisphaera sp. Ch08 TaxID=3120278 RepID=UPI003873A1D2